MIKLSKIFFIFIVLLFIGCTPSPSLVEEIKQENSWTYHGRHVYSKTIIEDNNKYIVFISRSNDYINVIKLDNEILLEKNDEL